MSLIPSRPLLRWAVPGVALVVALGAGFTVNALSASADTTLPTRTPAQLLADIQTATLDAGSGTVVEKSDLGLPQLPAGMGGGSGSSELSALLTGSHTLRVWYAGEDKLRVALLGALGESDVIRNGNDLWIWSSSKNQAQHGTAPPAGEPKALPSRPPTSPREAADQLLATLDPTTSVSTADTVEVAHRAAYDLVLTPKDTTSLIGSVRVAVDGKRHVPLRVQVYARGAQSPAFEIGFTQVSFDRPDDTLFAFTPPPGVKVTEGLGGPDGTRPDATPGQRPKSTVIGTGWTSVLVARVGDTGQAPSDRTAQAFLERLPRVSGDWGSGRLLTGTIFSALLTDDGRLLTGAVSGQRLTQVAADPAAALK
jgi:outer membrane lipoprotein-sorting protein